MVSSLMINLLSSASSALRLLKHDEQMSAAWQGERRPPLWAWRIHLSLVYTEPA